MAYTVKAKHTSIVITDYKLGDCPALEKHLSVWDGIKFKYVPKGFLYDKKKKELYIPRGVTLGYIERLLQTPVDIDFDADKYEIASIKLQASPRDALQKKSLAFLLGEQDFLYTKKYSQLLLNLAPGDGKTYITTAAICYYGMRSIIITHTEKIKNQWYETFTSKTDLDKSHICNINGSAAIDKLLKDDNLKYKVYLINHATLASYAKRDGWSSVGNLLRHLKVGIKVYDEAHLHFSNIMKIDLSTNTKRSIYLTATFSRVDRGENRLFDICFKNVVKYGNADSNETKRKHIIYLAAIYDSKPDLSEQAYMKTNRGFNKIRYAEYQMECDKFYNALDKVVDFFIDKEGKVLILSSKIDMTEEIKKFLCKKLPDKRISTYHSKIPIAEKDTALEADIICTTPKSAGTGFDLPGLRTVIMTESYSSKIEAEQVSGRLREYSDTDNTFYIELVDKGFNRVYEMYKFRLPVFKAKCLNVLKLDIDNIKDR